MTKEIKHPLIEHKVGVMRNKKTGTKESRELASEIAMFLCYEALKDAVTEEQEVETPIAKTTIGKLNEHNYAFVPILRAGMGMADGIIKKHRYYEFYIVAVFDNLPDIIK